jgi:hypothetical protein
LSGKPSKLIIPHQNYLLYLEKKIKKNKIHESKYKKEKKNKYFKINNFFVFFYKLIKRNIIFSLKLFYLKIVSIFNLMLKEIKFIYNIYYINNKNKNLIKHNYLFLIREN